MGKIYTSRCRTLIARKMMSVGNTIPILAGKKKLKSSQVLLCFQINISSLIHLKKNINKTKKALFTLWGTWTSMCIKIHTISLPKSQHEHIPTEDISHNLVSSHSPLTHKALPKVRALWKAVCQTVLNTYLQVILPFYQLCSFTVIDGTVYTKECHVPARCCSIHFTGFMDCQKWLQKIRISCNIIFCTDSSILILISHKCMKLNIWSDQSPSPDTSKIPLDVILCNLH